MFKVLPFFIKKTCQESHICAIMIVQNKIKHFILKEKAMDHDHHTPVEQAKDLFDALLLLKTKDEVERFFKDLCTPQEFVALNERWRVCQLLQDGELSYRQIHEITGTSLATIVRVARFLKDEPFQGYRLVLNRIKRHKKI